MVGSGCRAPDVRINHLRLVSILMARILVIVRITVIRIAITGTRIAGLGILASGLGTRRSRALRRACGLAFGVKGSMQSPFNDLPLSLYFMHALGSNSPTVLEIPGKFAPLSILIETISLAPPKNMGRESCVSTCF